MNEKITVSSEQFNNMADSEFLAYILAQLMGKDNKNYMPDYVFDRIEKILIELSKQEMN